MEILIKEISDTRFGLVTKTILDTKNTKVKNKIPGTSGLITINVLNTKINAVKNKIPTVSGLLKKLIMTLK